MPPPLRRPTGRNTLPGRWKHGPIPVIGVVGGIGSGKSVVAARLAELGGFLIDADIVGHALLNQRPVRDEVLTRFGPAILEPRETPEAPPVIDRRALGAIVFADPAARKDLESIIHPSMRHTFKKAIGRVARRGQHKAVVLDAAILFEAAWDSLCDRIIFVDAPREARLERVISQRGWDETAFSARESAQWTVARKREKADAVVLNSAGLDTLKEAIDLVWNDILGSPPARVRSIRREPDPAAPVRARRPGSTSGRSGRPRGR